MQVAKSRQAIENLIKKNLIEYMIIGDKNVTHNFMLYAGKKDATCTANKNKIDSSDIKNGFCSC
ncbi:hypothetical protein [Spirobacillus cienkowskii]|uniref:hypothetical protein n=1 Tax=Spirobacillus cienkowskii TaxID=495820 RepID=UPI0030D56DDC